MTRSGKCVNCGDAVSHWRRRGLCGFCYYSGVRWLYQPQAQNHFDDEEAAPVPVRATDAPPGSAEKILVMCERAERRERLDHPADTSGDILEHLRAVVARDHRGKMVGAEG